MVEAERCGFEVLDYSSGIDALPLGGLPWHHRDRFDRMLIAQSLSRGMTLMTEDPAFLRYGVSWYKVEMGYGLVCRDC